MIKQTNKTQLRDGYRRERAAVAARMQSLEADVAAAAHSRAHEKRAHAFGGAAAAAASAASAASPLRDQRLRAVAQENERLKAALRREAAARMALQSEYERVVALLRCVRACGVRGLRVARDCVTCNLCMACSKAVLKNLKKPQNQKLLIQEPRRVGEQRQQ
jgi:hypothetical protein